jgi:sulfate adenylyltransferase subunit 2
MPVAAPEITNAHPPASAPSPQRLNHLRLLEAESIHILREVASEFERPVMLYSIGKDSSVMLRLAQKAFYPGPIPFPLMHIDTGFKFREMLTFRDAMARSVARSCWCGATRRRLRRAPIPLRSIPSAAADC